MSRSARSRSVFLIGFLRLSLVHFVSSSTTPSYHHAAPSLRPVRVDFRARFLTRTRQKDVMRLYKSYLNMIKTKPIGSQANWYQFVAHEFRKHEEVRKRDVGTIEFLIRRGQYMLERLNDPSTKTISPPAIVYPRGLFKWRERHDDVENDV